MCANEFLAHFDHYDFLKKDLVFAQRLETKILEVYLISFSTEVKYFSYVKSNKKKRRQNRRKPPSAAEFFFVISR